MSYSEDRADSRSLTAVFIVLAFVAVALVIGYFAFYAPSRVATDTTVIVPSSPATTQVITTPGPAGAAGPAGASGAQGAAGASGASGAEGQAGQTGQQGDQGAAGAAGSTTSSGTSASTGSDGGSTTG